MCVTATLPLVHDATTYTDLQNQRRCPSATEREGTQPADPLLILFRVPAMEATRVYNLSLLLVMLLATFCCALSQATPGQTPAPGVQLPSQQAAAARTKPLKPVRLEDIICSSSYARPSAAGARTQGTTTSSGASTAASLARLQLSIPVYGNWCGPNFGKGEPVDGLDACCRKHDLCYDSLNVTGLRGFLSSSTCSCDNTLAQCAISFQYTNAGKISKSVDKLAKAIGSVFTGSAALKGCY